MVERQAADVRSGTADGVSVVLPALNLEVEIGMTIERLREELQPLVRALEFIVVDDGSTDGTAAAVTALSERASDVRLLRNRRNFGKGITVYLGILAARYRNVFFTDADLPFPPGSYTRVLRRLLDGRPFVVASRRMPESEILVRMGVLGYAARRHFIGMAFNLLVRRALGLPFLDTQCGLKAFERSVAIELFRRVRSPRFLFDVELFLAARQAGIAVDEVPVCIVYNERKSSVRLANDSARMLIGLATICGHSQLGHYRVPNPFMDPSTVRAWTQEVQVAQLVAAPVA